MVTEIYILGMEDEMKQDNCLYLKITKFLPENIFSRFITSALICKKENLNPKMSRDLTIFLYMEACDILKIDS